MDPMFEAHMRELARRRASEQTLQAAQAGEGGLVLTVWHLRSPDEIGVERHRSVALASFLRADELARSAWVVFRQGGYDRVATVEGSLEDAFRLTNNIDSSWSLEPALGVTALKPGALRSSSVGDVFQADCKLFVVALVGFTPLPSDI